MSKLTKEQIDARTKKSSYITLGSKDHISKIVLQLKEIDQVRCFASAKKIKPLSLIEARGLVGWFPNLKEIDNRPLSKIPIKDLYGIIQSQLKSNKDFAKFVEETGYGEEATVSKETDVPGDFSPAGLWAVLDSLLPDLDLSAPIKKKKKE